MSTPTNTFRAPIEIGPRNGVRFQRVIAVDGSENIYSMLSSTLLGMLGGGTQLESRFTLPGGEWEMLPMAATPWPHSTWLRTTMNRSRSRLTCSRADPTTYDDPRLPACLPDQPCVIMSD